MITLGPIVSQLPGGGSDVTPPPSGSLETVLAYMILRDAHGVPVPGAILKYRLVSSTTGSGDTSDQTVTANDDGVASFIAERGGYYEYWRTIRRRTVHITDETADPYELPDVPA